MEAMSLEQPGSIPQPPSPKDVFCRVCNNLSPLCLPLFKPLYGLIAGKPTTLAKILSYCSGLQILETELFLPHHICPHCVVGLRLSLQFKRKVLWMDRNLRQSHLGCGRSKRTNNATNDFILVLDDQETINAFHQDPTNSVDPSPQVEKHLNLKALTEEKSQPVELDLQEGGLHFELETDEQFADMEYPYKVAKNSAQIVEKEELVTQALAASKCRLGKALNPSLRCLICQKQMSCKQTFEYHIKLHGPSYDCMGSSPQNTAANIEECNELYDMLKKPDQSWATQKPLASRSRPRKASNVSLQCQICGKQLSTNNSFKYHMQLHGTATPFACKVCDESFKTRNALKGHATLHDVNNPNRCPTCAKVFRHASSLRTHLLIHSGSKPFECSICGKGLTQKSGYKKHMLTHTGERPHGCDVCGRSFRYSSNLIAHKRCHSQEKPHHCAVCQKRSFGSRSELNRHMLVHSSERLFDCGKCGKSFKRKVSLSIHLQSH
ncbi:zinc finger protein 26 [Drosophila ficusphila]|uniref:zinc finger protein 26 n=1 Tax=Drosophila ficusphila TaxID=30025 RepID=UPI0007E8945E|nr:zinc finger protein 26 [Drosophila ficusphila]